VVKDGQENGARGLSFSTKDMILRSVWKLVTDVKSARGFWEHPCGGFSR
jgi:hypothetical protein